MGIDKDENVDNAFDGSDGDGAAGIDEDEDTGTSGNTSTANIDKDEDVSDRSSKAAKGGVVMNAEKQLKVSQSKVFITIINRKRSYLIKKISTIKLFFALPIAT